MDVRMPDGTVVSGVPEGVTQSELLARYTKYSEAQAPKGLESIAPKRPAEVAVPAFDPTKPLLASDYVEAVNRRREESPERSVSDAALDAGITLLKGAIGLPESFVGVADIPTKGAIGKLLEDAGYRPREAKEILDTYLSEAQQSANRKVAETEGFLPTIGAMIQNPSTIATGIGESLPQMLGGAGVARGILKAAPKVGAVVAGGIGEGILGAGSAAEQTRGKTEDKLLTTKQALSALGSGVGTAAFGVAGGRLAQKFGLDDIDTMLAAGSSRGGAKSIADFAKRAGGSGISEGVFEEMPQSAQEKMWANYATDKPILEGVPEAMGAGLTAGFAMGALGGGAGSVRGRKSEEEQGREKYERPAPDKGLEELAKSKGFLTPTVRTAAVQPTEEAAAAPVPQDVNAPSQDRAAMLKELEDQLAELEPDYNKLQSPVAEIQQPEPVVEIQQPVAEAPKKPSIVNQLAREEQAKAGWNEEWPFAPVDLTNADFRKLIAEDPSMPMEQKQKIFAAGKKLGVISANAKLPEVVVEKQQPAADLSLEAQKYDTPDLRLKQSDVFGTDTTTALYTEMESHGRAALKNRNLTDGYAKKKDALVDAADAATVAFGTNDYSVFAPYAQTFPKMAKQLATHIASKTKPAAAPVAPAKLEPVPKYGTPEYNKLTPEEILRRMYAQQAAETAAPTTPAPANKAAAPMPSPVVPTKTITPKEQNLFEAGDKIEEPEGVAIIKENWIGGVSGLGDRDGMYDLYRVTGGKKYTDDVQKVVRQELGDKFKAYRLMSRAELEELEAGAMGSQFASFTLNPRVAQAFKNLPAHAKNKNSVVVEMDLTPEHVVMLGHPGEQELVVDYGQGYNPSEIKVLDKEKTPPKTKTVKPPGRKVAKETPLRQAAYAKNPLMTFLASRGLYHVKGKPNSQMNEFNAGKQIMVSGYGPVFKSSGKLVDDLLPLAIEDGYLPPDSTEEQLYDLIVKAVAGNKVEPLYSKQGVENTAAKYEERMAQDEDAFEERAGQTDAEWHGMSEQEYVDMMAREIATVSDEEFAELDQAVAELDKTPAGNMSVRAAMEALGFTEQEIQDEERRTTAKTNEAVAPKPPESDEASQAAEATSRQAPIKQTVTLYHGTSSQYDKLDPSKGGGMVFFGEDQSVGERYAQNAGGGRARLDDTQKYIVEDGVVYELTGYKKVEKTFTSTGVTHKYNEIEGGMWKAVGLAPDDGLINKKTIKPLNKAYPDLSPQEAQELTNPDSGSAGVVPKDSRIIEKDFSGLNLLDISTPEGRDVIAGLNPKTRVGQGLVEAAQFDARDKTDRNSTTQLNSNFWGTTKYASSNGKQLQEDIVSPLKAMGYDGIRFQDDQHKSVGLFDTGLEKEKAQPPAEFELAAQTTEELKAKQAEIDRLEKENARLEKEAVAKEKADAARDEFVLTGSDRPADVAAAQGQQDIFSAAEEAPAKPAKGTVATPDGAVLRYPVALEMVNKGYEVLALDNPRTYVDKGGTPHRTFEKGPLRISMTPQRSLFQDRNAVVVGFGNEDEMTLEALLVDPKSRNQGLATQAMEDVTKAADKNGITLYLEPTPLVNVKKNEVGLDRDQLETFYNKFGFELSPGSNRVMERAPKEVADEVVGPAEKPEAPRLTREPVTIEGQFTEVGEEKQRALITDQTKKLTDAQVGSLEKFYGFARDTEEFANAVRQDVVNFITKGAEYVNGKIRAIIRSMANGVMSVAVAFNPQFVSQPYTIAVPQYETRIEQVMQEVPASVQKQMSDDAKRAYATIYPAIKGELQANDKFFIVADKQTANTFVFNPDGTPFMQSKTLFGVGIGDFIKGDNKIVSNRITPAGLFDLGLRDAKRSVDEAATAGEYDFGKVFVLDKSQKGANGFYSTTIMHSVWTKETDAKQRLAALQKPGAEDSRYSFGCINVDKETYGKLVTNNLAQMDGAKIFIVPENGKDVMSFVNGEATYSTDIIRQRAEPVTKKTKVELQRAAETAQVDRTVVGKEEEGPMYSSIEPKSRNKNYVTQDEIYALQREAYEELQNTDEFKKSQQRVTDAQEEYNKRYQAVAQEAVRLLKEDSQFKKAIQNLPEEAVTRIAMTALRETAEKNVPMPKISEHDAVVAQNNLIEDFFKRKNIPEPREFSNQANQDRDYYSDDRFKQWFKNSKAVNKNGQPLVAFHTTDKNFNIFNVGAGITNISRNPNYTGKLGSWFTAPSLYDAEYEAGNAESAVSFSEGKEGDNTMLVHLSIQNPMEYEGFEDLQDGRDSYSTVEKFKQALIDQGYDGVVVRNSMTDGNVDRDDWVAFYPTQIKSAIGNRGTFDESGDILNNIGPTTFTVSLTEKPRSPSLKRRMDKLNRDRLSGKITDDTFINETDFALKQAEGARQDKPVAERVRGADFIRQKLLEAKRKGDLSPEAVDLAEWFIRGNEQLVDELGVSVRTPKANGVGGQYSPLSRIIILMKGSGNDQTVVHEILHHLERMMPEKVQQSIRKAWAKQLLSAQKKAKTPAEQLYFKLLMDAHYGENNFDFVDAPSGEMSKVFMKAMAELDFSKPGSKSSFEMAETLLKMSALPISNYQYFNPSEFWAVNGSEIVQGRFDAVQGGVLARLKNWLKELGQTIKGLFGFDSKSPIIKALDSLSKADGTFVTKEMLGESDYKSVSGQTNYQNYKGGDLPPAAWENIEDTKMDRLLQYALVDKQIDTKRVIENIKKAVGEISDKFNAYIKEELYHGRTAKATKDFLQKELLPLVKDMKAANVTIDEFDEYLHNRHAPEYNEHINKVNPNKEALKNRGSGISNDEAAAYMKDLTVEQKATFEKLAKQLDSIVKNTQDILIAGGIETKETIDAWRQQFPFYVPLKRDNLDYVNQGTGIGAGYGTKGGASKRATGSLKNVIDIFENIALQREKAIMKSEKARVGRALYGLAIKYPNSKFWLPINPDAIKNREKLAEELEDLGLTADDASSIAKEPASATFNKKTGLVEYKVNQLLRNSDNVFPIRINGKDRFIIFNSSDPRAQRMAKSLKSLDAEQLGLALGTIGEVTRFMASVNTQYNPVFGAWNFVRDVQGAALNLSTTDIAGEERKVLTGVWPALSSIYSDLRAQRSGKAPKGEWQELFERFQKAGGTTGYKDQFSRGKDKPGIVAQELKKLDRGNVRQAADAVFNWLSDYNDAMENAVRLSAFKVALDKGLSEDKAASLAKNLTVNFNRKGASSPTLQSLYAFFNASVQGTKRLAETLKGPAGKKIIAGGFAIGAAQAIALAMAGYDDDEPPQFLKDKNLIIPVFGGDYLIIPMPMGFNIFPGIGRLTTEYILGQAGMITGAKSLGDKALDATSLVLDSFNPLGSGSLLQLVSPTAFDPFAAIQSNRDAFGRPISKEDRATSPTPGFQRSREGASWFSKNLAELLNYVSSPEGTKYTKGAISPTADQIDYLIGQYTGGVGRELMKTGEYAKAVVKGETEDLPSYRVPIAGKLYGETTTPAAISAKFYLNVTELAKHENELKQRMKNKDDTKEYRAEHPEVRFINRANYIENQVTALNKQKKALQEKNAPDAQIKKIDDQKTALMKGLNDQIRKLQQ